MDPAPERVEWIFVWMESGLLHVKIPGGLKRLEWCVENWGFVSKEVCWHDNHNYDNHNYGRINTSIAINL